MKKVLLVLLVILLLLVGAGVWFWHSMGFTPVARLVPAETIALASLPDLPRSAFRWPKTTLARIGVEPEVQTFLEKPLEQLLGIGPKKKAAAPGPAKPKTEESVADILIGLKPTCIFAAVLGLTSQDTSMVVGFQFWGGAKDYDLAVARLRKEIGGISLYSQRPAVVTTTPVVEAYHGDEITATVHSGGTLYTARHGHWGFLANSRSAIEQVLDRAAGRAKDSLADNPRFKDANARIAKDPDFSFYLQTETLIDTLLTVGTSMGAEAIPGQFEQLRKVEAVAGALKLDGADIRDSIFVVVRDPVDLGTLTHKPIQITTRETTAYFDFLVDFSRIGNLAALPVFAPYAATAQNSRLPALITESLGPECAVALTWGDGEIKPHGVLAVQVRDAAKAQEGLTELLTLFPSATITELSGAKVYNFPTLSNFLSNPTLALVDGFVLVGIEPTDIELALASMKSSDSLEKSADFASAISAYRSANQVFGYVDIKKIFARGYPIFRQVMTFSALVMPNPSSPIDASKLPQASTILPHLRPIVFSQSRFSNGYLIESSGPITLDQAILLGAGAAGSFFKSSPNP